MIKSVPINTDHHSYNSVFQVCSTVCVKVFQIISTNTVMSLYYRLNLVSDSFIYYLPTPTEVIR